jgi:SAM-dependent methyltransferase
VDDFGQQEVQRIQTEYRKQIASHWQIEVGANLLEIGCGQGDMTAVLAEIVGDTGRVMAVDAADSSYGAPLTLGEATDRLRAKRFGSRIDFRFEFDIRQQGEALRGQRFDACVLAHSLWYFHDQGSILQTLQCLRDLTDRLLIAEWDLVPDSLDQLPHLLAVLIQGQIEAHKGESQANVRTPLSRRQLLALLVETGWEATSEAKLNVHDLQDADWEIDVCLRSVRRDLEMIPDRLRTMVEIEAETLQSVKRPNRNQPLPAYVLTAKRV